MVQVVCLGEQLLSVFKGARECVNALADVKLPKLHFFVGVLRQHEALVVQHTVVNDVGQA